MIFLKVKLDNIYMFNKSVLDLSYQRKLSNPTVPYEHLRDFPKVNFKRVCILTGANASGKTVLGKSLCMISNFLVGRDINSGGPLSQFKEKIRDSKKPASFTVDFVTPTSSKMHRIHVVFDENGLLKEDYRNIDLQKSYSYKQLDKIISVRPTFHSEYDRLSNNYGITEPGFRSFIASQGKLLSEKYQVWNYCFTGHSDSPMRHGPTDLRLFEAFLKLFDTSIKSVENIKQSKKDTFLVKFSNGDEAVIADGETSNFNRFSRGTIEAFELANFYQWVKFQGPGTYFLDEKLAYSHSLVEQAVLNALIENLPQEAQLFYTTHNFDILDMNLPIHSYVFLRKRKYSEIVHPERMGFINKNDRSLAGFVKNDVFGTLPSVDRILGL